MTDCCRGLAVVLGLPCLPEIVGKSFFYVYMDACVEYFVNKLVSGCRFTRFLCYKKVSEKGFAAFRRTRNFCVMCVRSVSGIVGRNVWCYIL